MFLLVDFGIRGEVPTCRFFQPWGGFCRPGPEANFEGCSNPLLYYVAPCLQLKDCNNTNKYVIDGLHIQSI